jgi:NADH dehydrogenase FAD-containing subunit
MSNKTKILILGGGFAGVETIGAINDLVHEALRYYPPLAWNRTIVA